MLVAEFVRPECVERVRQPARVEVVETLEQRCVGLDREELGTALARRLGVPVPLVDGIQAAVTMAEGLVRLNPRKATQGTYRRPAAKDSKGLAGPLADIIGHRES